LRQSVTAVPLRPEPLRPEPARAGLLRPGSPRRQRTIFLIVSGLSTAGSFAGLTAKGWILMQVTGNPLLLAVHFAALALPSLLLSGPAGVMTDRVGCEGVLIRAQWGLFAGAVLGALAIPLLHGQAQVVVLLLSTLLMGVASTYELTARNKYSALLVDRAEGLAPYLASFAVVFNVGKLVGPPLGGWLVALTGPVAALSIDAASYLLPIAAVTWLLRPRKETEQRSGSLEAASLGTAWRSSGPTLRHGLRFTALSCLVIFFHPALAPVMAAKVLGPSPQDLGVFTSVLAAGSIAGGVVLRRWSHWISHRPGLLMGACTAITALAQLGMAVSIHPAMSLAMTFVIGAGTAALLTGVNLIGQVGAPMVLRGRMAGMGQIAFLGGGGIGGLMAGVLTQRIGLLPTFALLGSIGLVLGLAELVRHGSLRIQALRSA
jgi:MFS family permease